MSQSAVVAEQVCLQQPFELSESVVLTSGRVCMVSASNGNLVRYRNSRKSWKRDSHSCRE